MKIYGPDTVLVLCQLLSLISWGSSFCEPKCEPKRITGENEYDFPFVAIVVRTSATTLTAKEVIALGSLVHPLWLLTTAFTSREKCVAIGLDAMHLPADISKVKKNKVLSIVVHPKHAKQDPCHNHIALLKLEQREKTHLAFTYWFRRATVRQPKIQNIGSVFWITNAKDNAFLKYYMPWCPHFTTKSYKCSQKPSSNLTCIFGPLPKHTYLPGQGDTVSLGGPLIIENELHGVYIGMNLKGSSRDDMQYAARLVRQSKEHDDNYEWIERVIGGQVDGIEDMNGQKNEPEKSTEKTRKTTVATKLTSVGTTAPAAATTSTTTTMKTVATTVPAKTSEGGGGTKDKTKSTKPEVKPTRKSEASTTRTTQRKVTLMLNRTQTTPTIKKNKHYCQMFADKGAQNQTCFILFFVLSLFMYFI